MAEAIGSVLGQSFVDFELILLNDGSTDNSLKVAQSFDDPRIHLVNRSKNMGLINTLNEGIRLARGRYICRMDQDDICMPNRFEDQINFLNNHPEIGVLGTAVSYINKDGVDLNKMYEAPVSSDLIECLLTRSVGVLHPTVMLRREVYEDFQYDPNFDHAEDYELWTRVSFRYKMANLSSRLLKYRLHESSVSKIQADEQLRVSCEIAHAYIRKRFSLDLPMDFVRFYFNPRKFWYPKAVKPLSQLYQQMQKKYPACSREIKLEFFSTLAKMCYVAIGKKEFVTALKMLPQLVRWISFRAVYRTICSFRTVKL